MNDPFALLRACRRQPGLTPPQKLLLLTMATYADDAGVCWPSQETLAADLGWDARRVRRVIAALTATGLVAVEASAVGPQRRGNRYWLRVAPTVPDGPVAEVNEGRSDPVNEGRSDPPELPVNCQQEDFETLEGEPVDQTALFEEPTPRRSKPRRESEAQHRHREVFGAMSVLWPVQGTMTRSEEGHRRRLVKELTDVGATGPELPVRFEWYQRRFGSPPPTPRALVKHWTECAQPAGWDPDLRQVCVSPIDMTTSDEMALWRKPRGSALDPRNRLPAGRPPADELAGLRAV